MSSICDAGYWMLDTGKAGLAGTTVIAGILDAGYSILVRPVLEKHRLLQGYSILDTGRVDFAETAIATGILDTRYW